MSSINETAPPAAPHCAACGAGLPADLPPGLCPRCAVKDALSLDPDTGGSVGPEGDGGPAAAARRDPGAGGTPSPRGLLPRTVGDYELLEEIARGGMGIVFKARQRSLNRIVAVKLLLFGPHASAEFIKRFRNEASAAAALQHPGIVAIHEVGCHEGEHFLAMDFVDGPSLAAEVRDGPLPPARAAELVKAIAEAIHYAHERGVLHRDLKPSNVLIDGNGRPRVADFGLAKWLVDSDEGRAGSELTWSGQVLGSPNYLPPEQAVGEREKVGRPSDVYSMGAMLYHLVTGRPPFRADSLAETLQLVREQEPTAPRLLRPDLPPDLETICVKCLEKEPCRRYGTAKELANELDRFQRGEPIVGRRVSRPERVGRWCRRNQFAATLLAMLSAALLAALGLLMALNHERNKLRELAVEQRATLKETRQLNKELLSYSIEGLQRMWGDPAKRMMTIPSRRIAALAEFPPTGAVTRGEPLFLSFGMTVLENPEARIQQHAMFLLELEEKTSQRLQRPVRLDLKMYKFQEDLDGDLRAGKLDFTRMGALRFVRARKFGVGLIPLVVPLSSHKLGVLFTRSGSGIQSWEDIRGRRLAFSDTNSTVSFWARIRLLDHGISGADLARFEFLDGPSGFDEDVQELNFVRALQRNGSMGSQAHVIEGVLAGGFDVGVAGKEKVRAHESRGLAIIPGTEFSSSPTLFVASPRVDSVTAQAVIETLSNMKGVWLEQLPERSQGFRPLSSQDFREEEASFDRVSASFPQQPGPAPPTTRLTP